MTPVPSRDAAQAGRVRQPSTPSRRRGPRRDDVVSYRVLVNLEDSAPAIWRRLELASDLFLDDVHNIVQTAFGWTESHLHVFSLGNTQYDRGAERFLCPFEVEQGEPGVPEHEVRLDEVLADAGDSLLYEYDFGDGWTHRITLESVRPRRGEEPRAACIDGGGAGPFEDSGGVWLYQRLVEAAADPTNPEHNEARERLEHYAGTADYDPSYFDKEALDAALTRVLALTTGAGRGSTLDRWLKTLAWSPVAGELAGMMDAAHLGQPVLVEAEVAEAMVAAYAWLLRRVSAAGGIKLTAAGYLPPAHVVAAMTELDIGRDWIGKGNREVETWPVLRLRESAQRLGLLRKHRGSLLVTSAGARLTEDPVGLWRHIAGRLPLGKPGSVEFPAGLATLLAAAAGRDLVSSHHRDFLVALLTHLGWRSADGKVSQWQAFGAARETVDVLAAARCFTSTGFFLADNIPTDPGKAFARAALTRLAGDGAG